jgi:hypothetical protein
MGVIHTTYYYNFDHILEIYFYVYDYQYYIFSK